MHLVKSYEGGRESYARVIVYSLFEEYLSIEELFSDNIRADVIEHMRQQYKKDLLKVVDVVLSHQGVNNKNKLILRLMEKLVYPNPAAYRDMLIRFSLLKHTVYSELALKASQLLEQSKLSELQSTIARSLSELEIFTEDGEHMDTPKRKIAINERMEALASAPLAVEDALIALFDQSDHTLQEHALETYIRRLYQPYLVEMGIRMQWNGSGLIASWEFMEDCMERANVSDDLMSNEPLVEKQSENIWGHMVIIKSLQLLSTAIAAALGETTHDGYKASSHGSLLHIALVGVNNKMSSDKDRGDEHQTQERMNELAKILHGEELGSTLRDAGIGVISCIIQRDERRSPMRYSFYWSPEKQYYEEEPLLRHLEPPLSTYLELDKLKGYENFKYMASRDRQWHLFSVVNKPQPLHRMFLRTLVRQPISDDGYRGVEFGTVQAKGPISFTTKSILRSMTSVLEELELNAHNATLKPDHAHMYLYIVKKQKINDLVPCQRVVGVSDEQEESTVERILGELAQEIHGYVGVKMHQLDVCEWEVKLRVESTGPSNGAWRVLVTNMTGHTCIVHVYRELEDTTKHQLVYSSVNTRGPLHGKPVNGPYRPLGALDLKRLVARRNNTTYCYDFPLVFETALQQSWASQLTDVRSPNSKVLVKATELSFADPEGTWGTPLVSVERRPGLNDVGMVCWSMEMSTPEFQDGRTILVVSNDVTFKSGSSGPKEDAFFYAVTEIACAKKLPLIYLAANSGARLTLAEEVKKCFKVGWHDEATPERGFQYVYLTSEDHSSVGSSVIAHELKLTSGETRWVIDAIVGKGEGPGVDDLSGTGGIAAAFSRAYKETFTLTYVTGRSVGIGAYLARLGMRCIQRLDQPMILTGFSALNKLLGREVYSSHMQLGGAKIMATNGVTHLTVSDDLEGVASILNWLSYVPPYSGGPLPISRSLDPPERPVQYLPKNSCDPRAAISGTLDGDGKWLGGIFDKDSFVETLEGWARTVVTGRARLGGIPVGVIAAETQTVIQVIPADPSQLDSGERVIPQAGQIWFPDSATKTAQSLMDFNREGLPLFILASWRGFSGGQRDLFEGILQAGSAIIESLRAYDQPVIVYIPMTGELRGGPWVVFDSKVNPEQIEMYADRTARGNVLEPEGIIEIKFRTKDLQDCMGRLDPQIIGLKRELAEAKNRGSEYESVERQIKTRERQLHPLYTQVALKFAELHDSPLRLLAKQVLKGVINWTDSRALLHKRLLRRVSEETLIRTLREAAGEGLLSRRSARDLIKKWFCSDVSGEGIEGEAWDDDDAFFKWKDDPSNYEHRLRELRAETIMLQLTDVASLASDSPALSSYLARLLDKLGKKSLD